MGVLLMAMTFGGVLAAIFLFAIATYYKKAWLKTFVLGGIAVWFVVYAVMLVGMSLKSEERLLALNEPKEFCGFYLDCHMHAAVTNVRRTKTIGDAEAKGEFYVVTVRVFSNAKRATLSLGGFKLIATDDAGNRYPQVDVPESEYPSFTKPIGPGKTFEGEVVFDLPVGQTAVRLDAYGYPNKAEAFVEKFLIGDEDSLLHGRRYFDLSGRGG